MSKSTVGATHWSQEEVVGLSEQAEPADCWVELAVVLFLEFGVS